MEEGVERRVSSRSRAVKVVRMGVMREGWRVGDGGKGLGRCGGEIGRGLGWSSGVGGGFLRVRLLCWGLGRGDCLRFPRQ